MKKERMALFTPITIGSLKIKNRILQCAMDPGPFVKDGVFAEYNANILTERARGGVGLITTGCTQIERGDGSMFADDREIFVPNARRMTDKIHSYGAKVFIQLTAGVGRNLQMTAETADSIPEVLQTAPSDNTPNVFVPAHKQKGMSVEHIRRIVRAFADAAEVVKEAGFDGIEVHALHEGYLLDQFSIASINKRTDEYGGDIDGRLRFAREILEAIREKNGKEFPVTIRFSIESKMKAFNRGRLPVESVKEFGRNREEAIQIAQKLEEMGYDALNCDNGSYDAWYWAHPPVYMPHLCNLGDVAYIKPYVHIPVYCAGRMEVPDEAGKAILEGKIDGIALGRQLLADAEWPAKVQDDRLDEIRPCIGCQAGCLRTFLGQSMTCALNPALGSGAEEQFGHAETVKKIAVIGGGIGGLEAARICAKRGHKVDLYEKTKELGGVFIAAAAPDFKESDRDLITWYRHEVEKLPVKVYMETEVSAEDLKGKYDVIITATGAVDRMLSSNSSNSSSIITAAQALRHPELVGNKTVIIGGGLTGCEIAYDLVRKNKKIVVVEMLPDILQVKGLCRANADMLRDLLRYYQVQIMTTCRVKEINGQEIMVEDGEGNIHRIEADTVITAIGYIPNDALYAELKKVGENCINIGDARKVGNLMTVIQDARNAVCKL